MNHPKVLLTSVCRPLGPNHGDAPSVGYELLHRQVTRAQGLFSPRAVHVQFALDYIAENLETPTVVLQYPSKRELISELRKGYDYVGVCFVMAVLHKMKETVALIRRYAPRSQIVLGGYGTVLNDTVLKPYADHICREEGVGFMRRLLGEAPIAMPYQHPLIVSRLKVFGHRVSSTGMIFAGLGCPNGCDFCCTSHFFARKHLKLLPEGRDIFAVIERYLETDPTLVFSIIDEDVNTAFYEGRTQHNVPCPRGRICPSSRSKTIEANRRHLPGTQPDVHGPRVCQGEPFAERRQEGAQFATRARGVM